MKKVIIFCALLFCTATIAKTINWYVDGSVYQTTTCNSGDSVTPPTPPAKYGYTFREWRGYTPIEYIESTGIQYIDTGVKASNNTKAEGDFYIFNGFTGQLFGSFNPGAFFRLYVPQQTTGSNIFDSATITPSTIYRTDFSFETKIRIRLDNTGVYIGNNVFLYTGTPNTFVATTNIYLGATSAYSGGSYLHGRIYYFQIWDNNILVRDFIPVLDLNDTPCMYDKVSHTFFYNSGTGQFAAGPVVNE